jgi:hypothetical protein
VSRLKKGKGKMHHVRVGILSAILLLLLVGCSMLMPDFSSMANRSVQGGIHFIDTTYGLKGWLAFGLMILLSGTTTAMTNDMIYLVGAICLSFMMIFFFGFVRL